ncbi:MAG: hypothetical protein KAT68_13620 [Bacteroidales bacterium]|nr:hypothetical protein [Bacteroidales bacterium]
MTITNKYNKQIDWLLNGDPTIRYQTYRDILKADSNIIDKERENILKTGWGKQLLDLQDKSGTWANGLYTPKWSSTFYTLLTLKRFGAKNNDKINKACFLILDNGFYPDKGINLSKTIKHSDTCITGMFLSILCHFKIKDKRIDKLVEHLFEQQMNDGGWNCELYKGATHSSFHSTISVLEGLLEYEKHYTLKDSINQIQLIGIEFLLQHKLFRSHRTGQIVDNRMLRFSFPPRWKYDIMRGLDYAREKDLIKDKRFNDAINVLKSKQTKDGFWKLQNKHHGKVFFDMEKPGESSRWNTLRAIRILNWWEKDD